MRYHTRNLLLVGLFLSLCTSLVSAQERQGALAFVNAVGLSSPTEILADGQSIKPEGFEPGSVTSFLALPSRPFVFAGRNGNLPSKPLSVTPASEGSVILVVFLKKTESQGQGSKSEIQIIPIRSLPESNGFNQRLVLLGPESPVTFLVNDQTTILTPESATEPLNVGKVKISTVAGETVADFSQSEAGNFLVVIFPDSQGGYKATTLRDNFVKFAVPAAE